MTSEQLTQAVLRAIREAEGNRERLMKLSWGCEVDYYYVGDLGRYDTKAKYVQIKENGVTEETTHYLLGNDGTQHVILANNENYSGFNIIGHQPQWSDVLVAIFNLRTKDKLPNYCILGGHGSFRVNGTEIKVDLTLTPEAAMLADPQLTKFLAGVLGVTE